jgi:hypothetical protein
MTIAPPEPTEEPAASPTPGEDDPDARPELPDPAFPEVLPGADPDPGGAPEPETQPDETG